MRQRREEFVLAAVGLDECALLQLALRDIREPHRKISVEWRSDDVIPGLIAIGLGLPLGLAHLVCLERFHVKLETAAILPRARQTYRSPCVRRTSAGSHRMTLAAAAFRKLQRKSVIFPDASRTGDNNTNGTPEEDNTDSKRRSRSLTRSSARARSMNTAALRAQMSAMRNFALGGFARRREMHGQRAQRFTVTADQRRRMHRAHAVVAGHLAH